MIIKKLMLLCVACYASYLPSYAQTSSVSLAWGADIDNNKARPEMILGEHKGNVFAVAEKNSSIFYQRYTGTDLNMAVEKEIDFPKINGKKTENEGFILLQDRVVWFVSQYADKVNTVYAYYIDQAGTLSSSPIEIFSADVASFRKQGEFQFQTSLDKSYLAMAINVVMKKEKTQTFKVKVIDQELKEVYKTETTLPIKEGGKTINIKDFCTDNDGNVYLLSAEKKAMTQTRDLYSNFKVTTFARLENKKYETPVEFSINNKVVGIVQAIFDVNTKGDLCIGGVYVQDKSKLLSSNYGIAGTFFIRLDGVDRKIKVSKFREFDIESRATLLGDKRAGKDKLLPNDLDINELVFNEDGSICMVGEWVPFTSQGQAIYGPIVVTSIAPDGEIRWMRAIAKAQADMGGAMLKAYVGSFINARNFFFSYLVGLKNDKIYIIYNDQKNNVGDPVSYDSKIKPLYAPAQGVPVVVTIGADGTTSNREAVEGGMSEEIKIRPGVSRQINQNTIIVYGSRKSVDKLGRVTIK